MDFEDTRHQDLRRYIEGNEKQLVGEVEDYYDCIRGVLRQGLKNLESEIDASTEPPNVCVFAPLELVKKDIQDTQITDLDYDIGREIEEGEFLLAMSIFLGYRYGHDFNENALYKGLLQRFYQEHLHGEDQHWIPKVMYYLNQRDFHEPHARFYPEYGSIVVNSFFDASNKKENIPEILEPMYRYMTKRPGDPKAAILHEMTHLYIHEESKYRKSTQEIAAINEAAGQSVSNVLNPGKIPSSSYYRGDSINKEVMQAARQVFNESTEGMSWNDAVSTIRKEAVRAINDVVDGEDPIRALREEDELRSRIVRIASYTIKRTEKDVLRDLVVVGFYSEALKDRLGEVEDDFTSRLPDVLNNYHRLGSHAEDLEEMNEAGKIQQNLIGQTQRFASEAVEITSLVDDRRDASGPEIEEYNGVKILDHILGNPEWTDPAFPMEDRELEEHLLKVLEAYRELATQAYEAAGELGKRAKRVEKEGQVLVENYDNERAAYLAKSMCKNAAEIEQAAGSSRKNLGEIEEMIEVAERRINNFENDQEFLRKKWRKFKKKFER